MKVLFYNHTGMVSGAERVLLMILNGMDRHRYEPVVVCPAESRMMELAQGAGVRTRGLQTLQARFTWRLDRVAQYLFSFYQVIRDARAVVVDEAPAFIHANSIRAGLVMSAATAGLKVPVIWHAHDILPRHPLSTAVRAFAALTSRNHILAVSQAVANRFRGLVLRPFTRRVPITVIHNSVDLDRFQPNADSRHQTRRALNLKADELAVGIVGQLTPRKGQLELMDAFVEVADKMPNAILFIVGSALFNRDEEYAEHLVRRAGSVGIEKHVRFLGARDDVPDLIRAFDVMVINSHEEPFGLTVLEGLASGTATIATAVGGTPEMINHGVNGLLTPKGNRKLLAFAVLSLLRDANLRAAFSAQGRKDALERFSIPRYLTELNSLYRAVSNSGEIPIQKSIGKLEVKLRAD
jgi:glycosyltransferase involved in cell wall biosynthesis